MIQRIQTLYLLIATLLSGGLIFFVNLWVNADNVSFYAIDAYSSGSSLLMVMSSLFFVSTLLTFIAIFQYKNRQLQFVLGRLSILTNLFINVI